MCKSYCVLGAQRLVIKCQIMARKTYCNWRYLTIVFVMKRRGTFSGQHAHSSGSKTVASSTNGSERAHEGSRRICTEQLPRHLDSGTLVISVAPLSEEILRVIKCKGYVLVDDVVKRRKSSGKSSKSQESVSTSSKTNRRHSRSRFKGRRLKSSVSIEPKASGRVSGCEGNGSGTVSDQQDPTKVIELSESGCESVGSLMPHHFHTTMADVWDSQKLIKCEKTQINEKSCQGNSSVKEAGRFTESVLSPIRNHASKDVLRGLENSLSALVNEWSVPRQNAVIEVSDSSEDELSSSYSTQNNNLVNCVCERKNRFDNIKFSCSLNELDDGKLSKMNRCNNSTEHMIEHQRAESAQEAAIDNQQLISLPVEEEFSVQALTVKNEKEQTTQPRPTTSQTNLNMIPSGATPCNSSIDASERDSHQPVVNRCLFFEIWRNPNVLKLPHGWELKLRQHDQRNCITFISHKYKQNVKVPYKEINLGTDGSIQLTVLGCSIKSKMVDFVLNSLMITFEDIYRVLRLCSLIFFCSGFSWCPNRQDFVQDPLGAWRHKDCVHSLEVNSHEMQCNLCLMFE